MQYQATVLNENVVFDAFMVYHIIKRLVTPFEKTSAYQLGIIDADGKPLKKRNELTTSAEKSAYGLFDVLVFNLKRIIEKLPYGKTRLASFAAALFLLKEQNNTMLEDEDFMYETFRDYVDQVESDPAVLAQLETLVAELGEDVPANNAGSGGIAGVGDGTVVVHREPASGETSMLRRSKKKRLSFLAHQNSR